MQLISMLGTWSACWLTTRSCEDAGAHGAHRFSPVFRSRRKEHWGLLSKLVEVSDLGSAAGGESLGRPTNAQCLQAPHASQGRVWQCHQTTIRAVPSRNLAAEASGRCKMRTWSRRRSGRRRSAFMCDPSRCFPLEGTLLCSYTCLL